MNYLINSPSASFTELARGTLVLAHGAGASMDSDFMNAITLELTQLGVTVVRFEFPYMQKRRDTGGRRPPDRAPILLECWRQVYEQLMRRDDLPRPLVIGGKSMGGRMATMIAGELHSVNAVAINPSEPIKVVCFGYPFHPPKKLDKLRTEHLQDIEFDVLVCQGTRDPMGNVEELKQIVLSDDVHFHWLEDGDHDLKPRVRSGFTQSQHIHSAALAASNFISR